MRLCEASRAYVERLLVVDRGIVDRYIGDVILNSRYMLGELVAELEDHIK